MERFWYLWRLCFEHWRAEGITILAAILAGRRWLHARRNKALDSKILEALQNHDLWREPRVKIAGFPLVWTAELGEVLSLDCDVVADTLERLEKQGRVKRENGNLDNPAPRWHIVRR